MVTAEESIPSFSDEYRSARSVFFHQFNDVDFYVEDEEQENFYLCILKKIFPQICLENIFPLGGKQKLIKHAATPQPKRKSVYLLDKDFDDLLGRLCKQANVFYLEKYCIENFLLEEKAFVKFIIDERPRLKAAAVARDLKFQSTWDEIVKQLSMLFALFFIVQKHDIMALRNTSYPPDCFCSPADTCCVDEQRVSGYAKQVKKKAAHQGLSIDVIDELKKCSASFELDRKKGLHGTNVSGEFILRLFANRIAKSFALDHLPTLQSVAYRLAQECDFASLVGLQRKVHSYLQAA